jgi:hypothetical protein
VNGIMPSHILVRDNDLFLIAVISTLVIASPSIGNYGYFDITKVVCGQPADPDQMNYNTTNSVNIQDIQLEKVRVGDIDVAYKMFGKGDPIVLFNGASDNMDAWDPSFLTGLSSDHTVIIFDQRGIGNTTIGSKPYTIQQLANDTAGLLDALRIPKADVMGYSLGGHIAQQFTVSYPEKVNRLILVATTCGSGVAIPIRLEDHETKRQWPNRLKVVFNFLGFNGKLDEQAEQFMNLCKQEGMNMTQNRLIESISYQIQRSQKGKISLATIPNYLKAIKLFCEMNDIQVSWKKSVEVSLEEGRRLMIGLSLRSLPMYSTY